MEKKIKELMDMDIVERVEGPTPWVNPVVILSKPDKDIRMCLDMKKANEAIVRERYPIPTVDEILQGKNGSAVFSKLDLKWGYHQLELTPESREITTFAVHNGVYRYKRLIFGVSSASEQYQHEIANALAGIEGVENISDDVIGHAPDHETHDKRLHARLSECGLTLNPQHGQTDIYGDTSDKERYWTNRRESESCHGGQRTTERHRGEKLPGACWLQQPIHITVRNTIRAATMPDQKRHTIQLWKRTETSFSSFKG